MICYCSLEPCEVGQVLVGENVIVTAKAAEVGEEFGLTAKLICGARILLFLLLDVSLRSQRLCYSIKQAAGNLATAKVMMVSPGIRISLAVSGHRPGWRRDSTSLLAPCQKQPRSGIEAIRVHGGQSEEWNAGERTSCYQRRSIGFTNAKELPVFPVML